MSDQVVCNLCGSIDKSEKISEVRSKPDLETDYGIEKGKYFRIIYHCLECSAYFNHYSPTLLPESFYSGFYNSSIDSGKLIERFKRITSLSFEESDNKQRVKRIVEFLTTSENFKLDAVDLLDVGTGTGVFLHEAKKFINNIYCVDPDPHSIKLVKELIAVNNAWVGSVENIPTDFNFDFISFNKVLEHVEDPINLLKNAVSHLKENGVIYIELPYSDFIISEEKQKVRAEFFIEHLVIYNRNSLEYLIKKAGLFNLHMDVIIEPSGKHSIFAFCKVQ
ncbi:class I SAM-dependent methyltransferase [Marivirga sp. S37H4]|uniref:Class I SAM-dependent methyltransferase n=1 Tax=Marivirga aurantiaca TaxID=2802615 RepID=A0A934WVN8_9BACT|nr:class I SAM-dependent methyltransferase [Marivirga aurantiaca]MBK6263775.1 class I SAM-dependent methyltransferase [Marivirga aurantiaca]